MVGHRAQEARFTSDAWVFGDVAYTGTWGVRSSGGVSRRGSHLYVWDVSDPTAPRLADSVVVDASVVNDVKVRADGTLAVLTHEGSDDGLNGITLLNLADPLHPEPIVRFTEDMSPGVHNVWIEGDHVYAVVDGVTPSAGSGLQVVDVSDPAAPRIVASFFGGDPGAPGQFLHDVYVRDGLAFLSHWNAGLIILDVGHGIEGGSPEAPVEVSRIVTEGNQVHNAWYWPATGYVFVGEEDHATPGSMHVVDAGDPRAPVEVASWRPEPHTDTPHNFWLDESRSILYLAWYTQGIRVLDVSGSLEGPLGEQDRELASLLYDETGTCGSGVGTCAWAPQLHEGLLYVSDLNSGLWVLRPTF